MCKVYLQRRDRLNMIKYNIYGFSQSMLIKYGLDVIDALLLRYFVDFKNSGKMIKEKFHGEDYYWIDYKSVIEYIPIINITTNNALRRRLRKLEDCNMLKHHTKVCKGCYSFYTLGENYTLLESAFKSAKKFKGSCTKVVPPSDEKPEQKRSEEHTSELQSRQYLVCRLLLEKKKTLIFRFFFFNDTATTEIYTLSLHDALPIFVTC